MTQAQLDAIAGALGRDVARGFVGVQRTLLVSGAIPIDQDCVFVLALPGGAGAFTVAAPGAANIGRRITLLTGTDFAHVATFTGTTLNDGTAGVNTTWTATAVAGCALTFEAISATRWNVVNFNLGVIAP